MKKIRSKIIFLFLIIPVTLFAHDGHVHTGTFWENAGHFILTNGFIIVPAIIAAYFLVKNLRTTSKVKTK